MSYDTKCHDLAEAFLSDIAHTDEDVPRLAQVIQDAIEDYLADTHPIRIRKNRLSLEIAKGLNTGR